MTCQSRNHLEDKLILGCADGSMVCTHFFLYNIKSIKFHKKLYVSLLFLSLGFIERLYLKLYKWLQSDHLKAGHNVNNWIWWSRQQSDLSHKQPDWPQHQQSDWLLCQHYGRKVQTVNNFTNINKKKNHKKKPITIGIGTLGPGFGQAHKYGGLNGIPALLLLIITSPATTF